MTNALPNRLEVKSFAVVEPVHCCSRLAEDGQEETVMVSPGHKLKKLPLLLHGTVCPFLAVYGWQ